MLINILVWALFGLIAGALAQFIMPGKDPGGTDPKGIIITIVLGLGGALLGGFLSSTLLNWPLDGFNWRSMLIAVVGTLLVLILYRLVRNAMAGSAVGSGTSTRSKSW